ncbi:MAG: hypothetical protein GF320_06335 [Armatimonadia bacterium]|nr:hypothetical protein [Armatimonadia bacterium]
MSEESSDKKPDQPQAGDAPAPEPPKKKSVSGGAVIILVLGVVAVLAGTFYAAEIKNFVTLQPWSKGGPLDYVDELAEALRSRDRAKVEALAPEIQLPGEEGPITEVKGDASPMAPALPVAKVTPTSPAAEGRVIYDYRPKRGHLTIYLPAEGGGYVSMMVKPIDGQWQAFMVGNVAQPPAEK